MNRTHSRHEIRVGIVGSGYIARGVVYALRKNDRFTVSSVLTRRSPDALDGFGGINVTNSVDELVRHSDIVVLSVGDPIYGTDVALEVLASEKPLVTMDSELQVTSGSLLASKGFVTEAQGDQPGCLASFVEEIGAMGLDPVVLGNIKGYLNYNPTRTDMEYWSQRNGFTLQKTMAFTDGTKLQIEQALVANGLGVGIARRGLLGPNAESLSAGAAMLAEAAEKLMHPISDYVLPKNANPGVFVVVRLSDELVGYGEVYKVRIPDTPYALLERPYHICSLEIPLTLGRVADGTCPQFNNGSTPTVSVAAVAKRTLPAGHQMADAIGGFDVRGEVVEISEIPSHVPIGLLAGARIERVIEPGETIHWDDVTVQDSTAAKAWLSDLEARNSVDAMRLMRKPL